MNNKAQRLPYLGAFLVVTVFVLAVFAGFSTVFGAASSTVTTNVTVGNAAPTISSVSLNGGSAIVLTPNATTSFNITYTITDNNGCSDITTNTTSTAFRTGVASTCAKPSPTTSNQNCYVFVTHTTSSCSGGISVTATDTVQIYYFADSTGNASATYPSGGNHWEAFVQEADGSGATGTATSTDVDVSVLSAVNVTTSSINYGTLSASSTSAQQNATTTNAGNSTTSLQVYALSTLTGTGTNSISTGSQKYATTTGQSFDAGSIALTASAVTVLNFKLLTPTAVGSIGTSTYWFLNVPAGSANDTYTGTNVFSPKWSL